MLQQSRSYARLFNDHSLSSGDVPDSIFLADPPCLRQIDTRIYPDEKKLHFIVYLRSWDLWGGFPSNLAGIQLLKEYMADEIGNGVEPGETLALSKGLHLYDMYFEVCSVSYLITRVLDCNVRIRKELDNWDSRELRLLTPF